MSAISVEKLRERISDIVDNEPARIGNTGWWQKPLIATAPIDQRFDVLPEIAADDHLHPHDLLPTAKSIVVFYIPFTKALVKENKKGDRPCRNWGVAYVQTNNLIERVSRVLEALLADNGYKSGGITLSSITTEFIFLLTQMTYMKMGDWLFHHSLRSRQ